MPLILNESCATCKHFDGDLFCALPREMQPMLWRHLVPSALIPGTIPDAHRVVCDLHDPKTNEADDDGA